jgi:small subunit ribosomal protein S21
MEVTVQYRDIEKALRNLKKKLQLDGLFGELKKRRHYEKPSVKKKNKQLEAEKRRRKLLKRARPAGGSTRPSGAYRGPSGNNGPAGSGGYNRTATTVRPVSSETPVPPVT